MICDYLQIATGTDCKSVDEINATRRLEELVHSPNDLAYENILYGTIGTPVKSIFSTSQKAL